MSKIMIVRCAPSILMKSLAGSLQEMGHEAFEIKAEMKELSGIKERQDAVLLLVDEELLEQHQALVFLKDLIIEKEMPVFMMGFSSDMEKLRARFGNSHIKGTYQRPFDVKEIARYVDAYVSETVTDGKKTILVVDDSGAMLRNVKGWLEDKYQVVLANSGAMAIKYLSTGRADLVLLDYEMPIISGKQVLEMIRSESDFAGIPVVFLTGKNDRESIMQVMSLKPEGYLLKTMKPETIVQYIDDFFEKRKIGG